MPFHPATIELVKRVAELIKSLGAAIARWANRVEVEPAPEKKD